MSSTATQQVTVPAGTWSLDPVHSSIEFEVLYMGVAPFRGAFREVEATLDADGLRGVAKVESVDVDSADLAAHLASPDFFDAANHPEIRIDAGEITRSGDDVTFRGTLEVKGASAPITLGGTITDPVEDPWGNSKLGLTLAGTVDRNDVDLTWNAPLPGGGQMLADEVQLTGRLVFVGTPEA